MVAAEATDQFCSMVCRSSSGTLELVFWPTVNRRIEAYSAARLISSVELVIAGTENCMFDCPPHRYTSPKSTFSILALSPVEAVKTKLCGVGEAACPQQGPEGV